MTLLRQQYELVRSSRRVMLNFIAGNISDLTSPVEAFDNKSLSFLLVHIANVYKNWIANYAMLKNLPFAEDEPVQMDVIRSLFDEADELVADFLHHFESDIEQPISNEIAPGQNVTATALQVFTHVTTHEFHHKGQLMGMCRLLGSIPPDTDIIRT